MNHFWIQLHTDPPPLDAVVRSAIWSSGEIELSWNDVPGVSGWTLWAVFSGRPRSRRELRGPRWRKARRMLRRSGLRQAWASS